MQCFQQQQWDIGKLLDTQQFTSDKDPAADTNGMDPSKSHIPVDYALRLGITTQNNVK